MPVYSSTSTTSGGGGKVTVDIDLADNSPPGDSSAKKFDVILSVQKSSVLALDGGPSTPGNGYKIEGDSIRWFDLELDASIPGASLQLQCSLKNCSKMSQAACLVVVVAEKHKNKSSRYFKPEWVPVDPCGFQLVREGPMDPGRMLIPDWVIEKLRKNGD